MRVIRTQQQKGPIRLHCGSEKCPSSLRHGHAQVDATRFWRPVHAHARIMRVAASCKEIHFLCHLRQIMPKRAEDYAERALLLFPDQCQALIMQSSPGKGIARAVHTDGCISLGCIDDV